MNKHQPTCHSTTAVQRCRDDGGDFLVYTTPTQKWKKFRGHDIATLLILILPCKLNSFQGLTMSVVVSHSTSMGLNSTIVFFCQIDYLLLFLLQNPDHVQQAKLHLKGNCAGEILSRPLAIFCQHKLCCTILFCFTVYLYMIRAPALVCTVQIS